MLFKVLSFLSFILIYLSSLQAQSTSVDHSTFDGQLQKFVSNGRVDYDGWQKEKSTLEAYLQEMKQVKYQNLPKKEKLAFAINMYNAVTIKLILDNLPKGIRSIKDIPRRKRWDASIVNFGSDGGVITLNHLEHKIIRKFQDARVHFAVNCASIGCPEIWNRAYTGAALDDQLNQATDRFMNDDQKGVKTYQGKGFFGGKKKLSKSFKNL